MENQIKLNINENGKITIILILDPITAMNLTHNFLQSAKFQLVEKADYHKIIIREIDENGLLLILTKLPSLKILVIQKDELIRKILIGFKNIFEKSHPSLILQIIEYTKFFTVRTRQDSDLFLAMISTLIQEYNICRKKF